MAPAVTSEGSRLTATLWLGVLVPPLSFLSDLLASYALVDHECKAESHAALHGLTLLALAVAAAAGVGAGRALADVRRRWVDPPDRVLQRERFMARAGIATAGFFALVVLAMAIPKLLLGACS